MVDDTNDLVDKSFINVVHYGLLMVQVHVVDDDPLEEHDVQDQMKCLDLNLLQWSVQKPYAEEHPYEVHRHQW